MTDAYFYVNIPYHRPATPSFFRLLQRWSGPLLLGSALAGLAWHQDHLATTPVTTAQASTPVAASTAQPGTPDSSASYVDAAAPASLSATPGSDTTQSVYANSAAAANHAGAHPALVFHNCSLPRMEVRKDPNDLITGVASVSSCDEAKVTLWDSSR